MKIGFNINYFLSWMGGRSFLSMIINASKEIDNVEVCLGLFVSNSVYKKIPIDHIQYQNNEIIVDFCKATKTDELCVFDNFETWITNEKIDILGPSFDNPNLSIPSINYIPDFQHKYIPHYFDDRELASRELQYAKVLKNSPYCLVGDKSVSDDIYRFYPWYQSTIFILPPLLSYKDEEIQSAILSKENREIEDDYIIVSSQRWQHKRHDLILTSFDALLKRTSENEKKNRKLVFTGDKTDYRSNSAGELFQQLIQNFKLQDNVIDLGIVPRVRQLNLIKNANALITASEFEGGIGASGVQEAMLMNTPVIAPRSPIFMQKFPIDINLCDFNNTPNTASILENAFNNKLLFNDDKTLARKIYKNSINQLESFFVELISRKSISS